jgi:alkylation response protein AidB-like acyl-CoA dehydrogenase
MTTSAATIQRSVRESDNGAGPRPILKLGSHELNALLDEFAAGASEREAKRINPYEPIRRIADAGLGRLRIPVAEGGAGVSPRERFQFLIRLGEADSNLVHILRVHYWFVEAQR